MRLRVFSALVALAFVICPVAATARSAGDLDSISYHVLKGDTLYLLAERFLKTRSSYAVLQRINGISDPRQLPIGSVLRIPRSLLRQQPTQAIIESYRGQVAVGLRPATIGMIIQEGDIIETGAKSFVSLRLPDRSVVSLPSQSAVRVSRLRRTMLTGNIMRLFAIEKGRASAVVTPMPDPRSSFEFTTPVAVSTVRGTRFRMNYDPERGRATSEVLEGKVAFSEGTGQRVRPLFAGYGSVSGLPASIPLLAPPDLVGADRVQDDEQLHFSVLPLAGAIEYRVQLGIDAGFIDVIDELVTKTPEANFASLPNGTYFVRVTAIDANGLEGRPSTYAFERRLNRISTSLEERRAGRYRQYLFRWRAPDAPNAQFRFQLSASPDGSSPLVDEIGLTEPVLILTDLPKGTYYWRVVSTETAHGDIYRKASQFRELRIEATR